MKGKTEIKERKHFKPNFVLGLRVTIESLGLLYIRRMNKNI